MWLQNTLAFFLSILVFTSSRAHHGGEHHDGEHHDGEHHDGEHGPVLMKLPIGSTHQSDNGTMSTNNSVTDILAHKLNCTKIEIKHVGLKINTAPAAGGIAQLSFTSSPVNTDKDVTPSPKNEATEKPIKHEKLKSKRSADNVNPSKNVTVNDSYSNVKRYTVAKPEQMDKPEPMQKPELTEMHVVEECTAPFADGGEQYNWYNIIVENGGVPGKVNATRLTPNATQVLNPCVRPIKKTEPPLEDLLYKYEMIEFEKVFRREEAFLRFAGTESEFLDIHGVFVWSPPGFHSRYYVLEYSSDDTGFYIVVQLGQKCKFSPNPDRVTIECRKPKDDCYCENGIEKCYPSTWRTVDPQTAFYLFGG